MSFHGPPILVAPAQGMFYRTPQNRVKPVMSSTLIRTTDPEIVDEMMKKLEEFTWNNYPDSVTTIKKLANGAAVDYPIEFKIRGSNLEELYKVVEKTKSKLKAVARVKNISDNGGPVAKK